jgi:hypothetical protein
MGAPHGSSCEAANECSTPNECDIVGYSKFSINHQHAAIEELNQIVFASEQFQRAEAANRLIKIPTGDGMVLVFYTNFRAILQLSPKLRPAVSGEGR